MVSPVTGPFNKVLRIPFPAPSSQFDMIYQAQTWYRQKPPYSLRLDYSSARGVVEHSNVASGASPVASASSALLTGCDEGVLADAHSKAYQKFVDQVREKADAATALAEYRSSADMMLLRTKQLIGFARAVNRLDFHTACGYLNLDPKTFNRRMRMRWEKDKSLASVWLEVHFGWVPLIKDIYQGLEILTNPILPTRAFGRASGQTKSQDNRFENSSAFFGNSFVLTGGVQLIADVEVTNPNLRSLSQFGVTNPMLVLWELIPFSFIWDWFFNVSQVLGTFDDLFGVSLTNLKTTIIANNRLAKYQTIKSGFGGASFTSTAVGGSVNRISGIKSPGLRVRPIKAPSLARAATAISLLVGLLPRH